MIATIATTPVNPKAIVSIATAVAYDMTRKPVRELSGQPVAEFVADVSRRSPRQLFFCEPPMVRLPALGRIGLHGPVRVVKGLIKGPSIADRRSPPPGFAIRAAALRELGFEIGQFPERVKHLQSRPAEILVIARHNRQVVPAGRRGDIAVFDRNELARPFKQKLLIVVLRVKTGVELVARGGGRQRLRIGEGDHGQTTLA